MATFRTYENELNPRKALIFRIVHIKNIPWIFDNGLHCGNSKKKSSDWIPIGNLELTACRAQHPVRHTYGGFLNDYVPFYFTPFSPMLLNIKGGRNGVIKRNNEEIAILVSSLHTINTAGLRYLFTDAHAYTAYADFYNKLEDLRYIDWEILQKRIFSRDQDDPSRIDRYQAEALIYSHVPVTALLGVVCYTERASQWVQRQADQRQLQLRVLSRSGWYF